MYKRYYMHSRASMMYCIRNIIINRLHNEADIKLKSRNFHSNSKIIKYFEYYTRIYYYIFIEMFMIKLFI